MGSRQAALLGSVFGFGVAALAPGAAMAQAAPAADAQASQLGEVIVTATRREQKLQEVPVAVTAVSGRDLDKSGFREVVDLQYLAPNVTFSATNPVSNGGGYQIRGVGTQTYDSGVEQTVGLVIDGVVVGLSRDPGATGFADVERVEVLRGPQGTLFGKNASAGVIQVITHRPELGALTGDFEAAYGTRNDRLLRGTVNLPVSSTAALRVSAFYDGQDGAIPDIVNGTKVGDRSNEGVRAKLLWKPADALSVLISAEYQKGFARDAQIIQSLGTSALYNSQFAGFSVQPGPNTYVAFNDGDWRENTRLWATSAQIDYALGDATLTSITAYRALQTTQLADIDAAPVDILNHSDGGVDSYQVTQELRLTSPSHGPLQYVLGAYFYRTHNAGWAAQYGNYYGLLGLPVVVASGRRDQVNDVRSYAFFGQGSYAITDTLKFIGGLRYTNDRNDASSTITPLPFPAIPLSTATPYSGVAKADNVSGKVGLQFEPSRNFLAYATFSTGYNGPAIDGTTGVARYVQPETVKSYEIGEKATLFDRRVTLNVALYSEDFHNFQTTALDSTVTPPAFVLTNAGLLRARGVEAEASWRATSELTLSASGAYNDAKYRDYLGPCYAGQPVSSTVGTGCYVIPTTTTQVANYAGYALPNAPRWSYTLRADYSHVLGNGMVFEANGDWAWREATQAVIGDPLARVPAYGLLNGTIGVSSKDARWRLSVYARNLLDKRFYAPYSAGVINPGGYSKIVSPDAFRTVGIDLSLKLR